MLSDQWTARWRRVQHSGEFTSRLLLLLLLRYQLTTVVTTHTHTHTLDALHLTLYGSSNADHRAPCTRNWRPALVSYGEPGSLRGIGNCGIFEASNEDEMFLIHLLQKQSRQPPHNGEPSDATVDRLLNQRSLQPLQFAVGRSQQGVV